MNKEMIDKCLAFAEGNKGKFTILMVKKPNFPESLIEGTEKQQAINVYVDEGLTTRQIAEKMNCTQPNIVEHLRNYRRGVAFYSEWCNFWEYIENVRRVPVDIAFKDVLSKEEIEQYRSEGIFCVGDLLMLTVTKSFAEMSRLVGSFDTEQKTKLFTKIRNMCYELLTSENF